MTRARRLSGACLIFLGAACSGCASEPTPVLEVGGYALSFMGPPGLEATVRFEMTPEGHVVGHRRDRLRCDGDMTGYERMRMTELANMQHLLALDDVVAPCISTGCDVLVHICVTVVGREPHCFYYTPSLHAGRLGEVLTLGEGVLDNLYSAGHCGPDAWPFPEV